MTRPPKFQIDLTEQFPTLQNAPIVEAVIQFNAPPRMAIEPGALRKVLEENCDGYLISDQVQFEAGLTGSPGNMEVRQKTHWDGFRLTSEDGKHICQWKRNCLVFSRLHPYVSWPQFMEAALPFWRLYEKTAAPQLIEGVGVRFISQIPLRDGERPSKFVQKVALPLRGLGLRSESFFHQDTIPVRGYPFEVRLMRAMGTSIWSGIEILGEQSRSASVPPIDFTGQHSLEVSRHEAAIDLLTVSRNPSCVTSREYSRDDSS